VHAFGDPWVIEGQGSAGIEITEQLRERGLNGPEQIVACCGGGGLASGLALACPDAEIIIVEPEGWDDIIRSLAAGEILPVKDLTHPTYCDALQTPQTYPINFEVLMSKTTFEDYKIAIWREFEIIKKNDITGFFSDLSPAMVRDYYVHLIDKGLSKADEEIMKSFFETKENESLKKSVNNSNTDKFKPVISFLTGKTKNPDKKIRVELAAILISFEQRPLQIYWL